MRVCHIKLRTFLPASETFIYRRVCDPEVESLVLTGSRERAADFPLPPNVTVRSLDAESLSSQTIDRHVFETTGQSPWYTGQIIGARAGVVHAHFLEGAWAALPACRQAQIPLVASFYEGDFHETYYAPLWWPRARAVFQSAACVITVSDFMVGLLQNIGCPQDKLMKIPCGVDLDEITFQPRSQRPDMPLRILCIARLHPLKGIQYLLRACQMLKQDGHSFEARIIGDGIERERLLLLRSELGLCERVDFLLDVPRSTVIEQLKWCHLLVLPTLKDSQGLVLLEAQASGAPVVSTRTGGIPESLEEGKSGLLVPAEDPCVLTAAIRCFIEKPGLIASMGDDGRRFVESRFSHREELSCLRRVYRDLGSSALSLSR
jgi:glycosyltransferase involved in cell wall biosynthesis